MENNSKSIEHIFSKTKAVAIMKTLHLFSGLFDHEFEDILSICSIHKYIHSAEIFKQDESAKSLFVILVGTVQFSTSNKGVINIFREGDVFGEMGVITQNSRAATAHCLSDVICLEISKNDFDLLLGKQARISYIIMKNMATELAERYLELNNENFSVRSNQTPQVKNCAIKQGDNTKVIKIYPCKNNSNQVKFFRIGKITNGSLSYPQNKGSIFPDDFISKADAEHGICIKPTHSGIKKCWFEVECSSDGEVIQSGTEKSIVYIFIY